MMKSVRSSEDLSSEPARKKTFRPSADGSPFGFPVTPADTPPQPHSLPPQPPESYRLNPQNDVLNQWGLKRTSDHLSGSVDLPPANTATGTTTTNNMLGTSRASSTGFSQTGPSPLGQYDPPTSTNQILSFADYVTPNGSPAVQPSNRQPDSFVKSESTNYQENDVKVPINSLGGPNGSPVINHESAPTPPQATRPVNPGFDQSTSPPRDTKPPTNASATNPAPPKKRTRATPEQLAVLEETFMTNTSPNSRLREQLSRRLGMSERSIQIWFQNRRAKVKMMHKRSCQMQEEAMRAQMAMMPHYLYRYGYPGPPTARIPLSRQVGQPPHPGMAPPGMPLPPPHRPGLPPVMDPQGRPGWLSQPGTPHGSPMHPAQVPQAYPSPLFTASAGPQGPQSAISAPQTPSSGSSGGPRSAGAILPAPGAGHTPFPGHQEVGRGGSQAAQLACEALSIGSWRRVALGSSDLRCFCDFMEKKLVWFISDNSFNFKMEFPTAVITGLELSCPENATSALLTVDISQPPSFFMEIRVNNASAWQMCRDFTESKQASTVLRHVLRGHSQVLRSQLLSILDCEKGLGNVTMIDGAPYDHNFHRRIPSGQPLGGVDVGAPASLNTSAGTPPPPRQPSGLTPKRANSVGLFNSYRPIPESSQTSSPAATPLGTPVNQDHSQPSSFAGAAAASQMFQMNNGGGMRQGDSTTSVMNMANLSVNTPPSVAQDSLQSTLGIQGGNSTNYSPLDHHSMPPAAFANARPLSLPPGPQSNLAFSVDNASGGSNTNQSHNNMDPKLLTDDVRGASQQQTQVNDNNAHDSRSNSLNDSMPAIGNHGAGEQQQVVTAASAGEGSSGANAVAPGDFLFESSDLLSGLYNQDVLV